MIGSLTRIFFFIGVIAAITYGASFIIDTPGEVRVAFDGAEYSLQPILVVIGILVLFLAIWLGFKILGLMLAVFKFFNGDETAISRYLGRNRERRGFEALADGMVALAAGEGRTAVANAAKAERYLDRPELTNLINAQAAELSGDTSRAMKYYKTLLGDDRTRFVGVRGLLQQKLADGDTDTALALAQKAYALKPGHDKTLDTLFELQSKKGEWKGVAETVAAKVKANYLPRDVGQRREAVAALAEARNLLEDGDIEAGKAAAIKANKLSPALVPAASLAAEMHLLTGGKRAAASVLKKAWTLGPHPELAASFAEIEPKETPGQRLRRFGALTGVNKDHSENKLLRGELALADEDFPAARRAVRELAETDPTTRSLTIMAAIEKGEGADDTVVRGWLAKALNASRGPQWICNSCGHIHTDWVPTCINCESFDTLDWKTPPEGDSLSNKTGAIGFTAGMLTGDLDKGTDDIDDVIDVEILDEPTND